MAEYVTKIRTEKGDMQIDYNALANKPTAQSLGAATTQHKHTTSDITNFPSKFLADGGNADTIDGKHADYFAEKTEVEAIKDKLDNVSTTEINYIAGVTKNIQEQLNEKASSIHNHSASDITSGTIAKERLPELTVSDIGAASATHYHSTADITSGTLTIERGGHGAENGADGLKNLFAAGNTILSSHQYGDSLPDPGARGRIFFKRKVIN